MLTWSILGFLAFFIVLTGWEIRQLHKSLRAVQAYIVEFLEGVPLTREEKDRLSKEMESTHGFWVTVNWLSIVVIVTLSIICWLKYHVLNGHYEALLPFSNAVFGSYVFSPLLAPILFLFGVQAFFRGPLTGYANGSQKALLSDELIALGELLAEQYRELSPYKVYLDLIDGILERWRERKSKP